VGLILRDLDARLRRAVSTYWATLESQSARQRKTGDADRGGRAAVTGGKQMMGFSDLVNDLLVDNGVTEAHILVKQKLELPGYFRPTKKWDMLVIHGGHLVAAVEFKTHRGSFGNNFNNRTEEAIGTAHDLWVAFREAALGRDHPRPWLGWVMLLQDSEESRNPVRVAEPHFKVRDEFRGTSYAERYELLLRKLVGERLYDSAALSCCRPRRMGRRVCSLNLRPISP
jgi:hypothetical protein